MGSLSAGPGSPTASTDKALGRGELAPGASGAAARPEWLSWSRCPRTSEERPRPRSKNRRGCAGKEPLTGLSSAQICPSAKRSLRKHLGQCRPSSQIKFLPNYSPISPKPVLNFTRFGSGAELTHQEPSRTALCQGIPLQVGPWLLFRLPRMRQSEVFPPQQGKPRCCKQQNSRSRLQSGGCFPPS